MAFAVQNSFVIVDLSPGGRGGEGVTLGIFGWGCATGTLEPLVCSRGSSAEIY